MEKLKDRNQAILQYNCLVGCPPLLSGRVCDGCADAAEFQGADGDPVAGLPRGPERQGHGGNRPDRLWKDISCKPAWTL